MASESTSRLNVDELQDLVITVARISASLRASEQSDETAPGAAVRAAQSKRRAAQTLALWASVAQAGEVMSQ